MQGAVVPVELLKVHVLLVDAVFIVKHHKVGLLELFQVATAVCVQLLRARVRRATSSQASEEKGRFSKPKRGTPDEALLEDAKSSKP